MGSATAVRIHGGPLVTDVLLEGAAEALFRASVVRLQALMERALQVGAGGAFLVIDMDLLGEGDPALLARVPPGSPFANHLALEDVVLSVVLSTPDRAEARRVERAIRAPVAAGGVRLVILHPQGIVVTRVAPGVIDLRSAEGACEVHDWPTEGLALRVMKTMRERHGKGGLTCCVACVRRAKADADADRARRGAAS